MKRTVLAITCAVLSAANCLAAVAQADELTSTVTTEFGQPAIQSNQLTKGEIRKGVVNDSIQVIDIEKKYLVALEDGRLFSGVTMSFQPADETVDLQNRAGKRVTVPFEEVEAMKVTPTTLPDNYSELREAVQIDLLVDFFQTMQMADDIQLVISE